jgi:hypothetical protein
MTNEQNKKKVNYPISAIIIFVVGTIICLAFLFNDQLFLFFFVLIITAIISSSFHIEYKKRIKDLERKERLAKIRMEEQVEKEMLTQTYTKDKNNLISKYGNPDKTIILKELDIKGEIIAFGDTGYVWILGTPYLMKDILDCKLSDSQRIIRGSAIHDAKSNNRNMAKRAIVGSLIAGEAGAIIGGITSKKQTVTKYSEDKIYHNYTIVINVNNLSNPIIEIPLGDDDNKTNEIMGFFNVIINRNSHQH